MLDGGKFTVKGRATGGAADWTRQGTLEEEMKGSVALQTQGEAFRRVSAKSYIAFYESAIRKPAKKKR